MNSKHKSKAERIIAEVVRLLSRDYLDERIDRPVQDAVASFKTHQAAEITQHTFLRIVGDFVRHIYKNALSLPIKLTTTEACAEALAILERDYTGMCGRGYYAAFLEASGSELNNLELVLTQMAKIMIANERKKYVRWIFTSRIRVLNWKTKHQIAATLLENWKEVLPKNLLDCPPAQLADLIPELIGTVISCNQTVTDLLESEALM